MEPFTLLQVENNEAAINEATRASFPKFIAGGTNLIDLMKYNVEKPKEVIDINGLKLDKIEAASDGSVRIGALVKNSDLAYDPAVSKRFPVLSQALLSGASAQLRNMATVGGNLLQRTRCPYFYNVSFACNKREPGSGCSAIHGYNRMLAILGTSNKCIATNASDMNVALTALDAVVNVQGTKGERAIPITNFYLLPGDTPHIETVLEKGDLITSVSLPNIPYAANASHYLKVRDRASFEFALASAAVALNITNGKIKAARIALGGVGTKPWRASRAEEILTGASPDEQTFKKAAEATLKEAKAYTYNSFKIELAKRTMVRALTIAGGKS